MISESKGSFFIGGKQQLFYRRGVGIAQGGSVVFQKGNLPENGQSVPSVFQAHDGARFVKRGVVFSTGKRKQGGCKRIFCKRIFIVTGGIAGQGGSIA